VSRVVIFDFDRTVINYGSYTPFLLFFARRHAPWRLIFSPAVIALMLCYKARLFSRARLKELIFLLLIGKTERAKLDAAAHAFADHLLANKCYAGAVKAIKQHLAQGDTLIMATASFSFYAQIVAERLGFHHTIASELTKDSRYYIPRLMGENCYGQAKADQIKAFLAQHNYPPTVDIFYTDHGSDIPAAALSKACVFVNPDAKLKAYARARENTEIVTWENTEIVTWGNTEIVI
jgi:phosphatidylglycerophosphatase C